MAQHEAAPPTQSTDAVPASLWSGGNGGAVVPQIRQLGGGGGGSRSTGACLCCFRCPGAASKMSWREPAVSEPNQGPKTLQDRKPSRLQLAKGATTHTPAPCSTPASRVTRVARPAPASCSPWNPGTATPLHPTGSIPAPLVPLEKPPPWPGLQEHPQDTHPSPISPPAHRSPSLPWSRVAVGEGCRQEARAVLTPGAASGEGWEEGEEGGRREGSRGGKKKLKKKRKDKPANPSPFSQA